MFSHSLEYRQRKCDLTFKMFILIEGNIVLKVCVERGIDAANWNIQGVKKV